MAARIRVRNFEPFPDEQTVIFTPSTSKHSRLAIHPWSRDYPAVYIALGLMDKNAGPTKVDSFENIVIDREDFVQGILAVFPELTRAC